MMPHTTRQVREASNEVHFSVLTSGFTAVTNSFIIKILEASLELLNVGRIEMIKYPDFFEVGYSKKWDKDVYHFLNNVAKRNEDGKMRGICHRAVRSIVKIWEVINEEELHNTINEIITTLQDSYDGSKNPEKIQKLKGMIREFEEELVWAHYGVPVSNIHHLRLGFYKGDIFTEQPDKNRDIIPMLEELRKHQPTILSLAMDPEGSGPDTHYKVLQVIAGAVKEWQKEKDLSDLRILGYRNVWFKYHPAEADIMVPVSLNAMDVLQNSFTDSYLSQVNASFPSYEYDGKFCELTQKIWVNQLNQVQYVLGKNYFYENDLPMMRSTHGFVYLKELNVEEFVTMAEELEKAMEAKPF
jgi:glucosamine-6-phosphate deaminase